MRQPPVDFEIYPPFTGFPKEAIVFLKQLKKNNNREWFASHKSQYEEYVKYPMQTLIASLRIHFRDIAPEMEADPKRSMFRIYRDTRFSKNKAPYKTHVAAVFHPKGHWEDGAGYYVHVEPGSVYVGGGIYMPDGNQLKKIRAAIANNPKEFKGIVQDTLFRKRFRTLEGEKLQRAPLGYPVDHPMIEWLKYKSFFTGVEWEERRSFTPKFVDGIVNVYKELLPLVRFLNEALGK